MFTLIAVIFVLSQIFNILIFGGIAVTAIVHYIKVRKENYELWYEDQDLRNEIHDLDVENARVIERNYYLEVMITAMMNGQEVEFVYHDDSEDMDFKAKKERKLN